MSHVAQTKKQLLLAALLSEAVYAFDEDRPSSHRALAAQRLDTVSLIKVENAACIIGVYTTGAHKQLWIAVPGSKDSRDWSDNFDRATVSLRTGLNVNAHSGFARQFRLLLPDIRLEVESFLARNGPGAEVFFCGHSLGSAVATLAAVYFAEQGVRSRAIGFATPRVFDDRSGFYVDHCSKAQITRVELPTDWVCDVPPRYLGFSHVGRALWIDAKGRVTTEDRPPHHKALMAWKRMTRCMFAWKVHLMKEYLRRLELWNA